MSLKHIVQKMRETMTLGEIAGSALEAAKVILLESVNSSKVSQERLEARYKVCQQCPHLGMLDTMELYCDYCKCPMSVDRKIINRALYSTVSCPDPKGDRWKAEGC